MGDSVPPPSRPPEEISEIRKEDKNILHIPSNRVPDLGEKCNSNPDMLESQAVVLDIQKERRKRLAKVTRFRETDRSMHDIEGPGGARRGGVRKRTHQAHYLDGLAGLKSRGESIPSISGGVKSEIDVAVAIDRANFVGRMHCERLARIGDLFTDGFVSAENIENVDEIIAELADKLLAFVADNCKDFQDEDVESNILFHPVAKIIVQVLPLSLIRKGINDGRIISIVRALKDDSTKTRLINVLNGFLRYRVGRPGGKYT